jgi:predicted site-specific integrase-resolvase
MNQYVTPQIARKTLGVSDHALKNWDAQGLIKTIKTPGGKRLYDISSFVTKQNKNSDQDQESDSKQVCYCRVSTQGQKEDLVNQIKEMREQFPNARIISDIGSGINFKRKGLRTILELSSKGLISEVVVAYRDRLCRFSFELIEWMLQLNGVKLLVLHPALECETNQSEMVEDILAIINVFSCRVNGQRRYQSNKTTNQQVEEIRQTNCQPNSSDPIVSQSGNETKTKIVVRLRQKNLQPGIVCHQKETTKDQHS